MRTLTEFIYFGLLAWYIFSAPNIRTVPGPVTVYDAVFVLVILAGCLGFASVFEMITWKILNRFTPVEKEPQEQ